MYILNYSPGQLATIVLEVTDADGYRANSTVLPTITRIIFPNSTTAVGYPKPMTVVDTGLYTYSFVVPSMAVAVGSYLVDVSYIDPSTSNSLLRLYQIVVNAPMGSYSVSTS